MKEENKINNCLLTANEIQFQEVIVRGLFKSDLF
jgi:hypothetical protein